MRASSILFAVALVLGALAAGEFARSRTLTKRARIWLIVAGLLTLFGIIGR